MSPSFSRTQFPPGGWQYHQPQTGWSPTTPLSSTFDQTVLKIIEHRLKNPALCIKHRLSTDINVVGNELEKFTKMRLGIPLANPAPPSVLLPGLNTGPIDSIEKIKRMAAGSGVLMDWAESGQGPVDQATAEDRAKTCARCPLNQVDQFEEWLKMPLTLMLQQRIARISAMKLKTQTDAKLGLCNGLFAPCSILVHEPSEIAQKKVSKNPSVNLWDLCWIKK